MKNSLKTLFFVLIIIFYLPTFAYAQETVTVQNESTDEIVCEHLFKEYTYDNNATYVSDGTKTAFCSLGCGATDVLTQEGTMLVLDKPESVTASQSSTAIRLNWSKVDGATGYRIYYKTSGKWKKIVSSTDKLTHRFGDRQPGEKIRFAVRAFAEQDDKTVFAPEYTTIKTATECLAPETVTSTQTLNKIKLSWSESEGADGYQVYYRKSDSWKKITSFTQKTSVTYSKLPSGESYTFAVRPYVKADKLIGGSYKTIYTSTLPDSPKISVDFASKGKIAISWDKVSGADGYRVYYKTNSNKYKFYKSYSSVKKLTFNLKSDNFYTFAVKAYKKVDGGTICGDYTPLKVHIGTAFDRKVVNPKKVKWNLVLVNHKNEFDRSYTPVLASIPNGYKLDYRVAPYFNNMYNAAAKEGINLMPVSTYRTYNDQLELYNETIADYMSNNGMTRVEAEKKTAIKVLPPGTSEHNIGLAIDIGCENGIFANSSAYSWLKKNAHKYGFIERYTKEKQAITGIIPEPWHWRFVGVKYAGKIKNSGLCLEEYFAKYNIG